MVIVSICVKVAVRVRPADLPVSLFFIRVKTAAHLGFCEGGQTRGLKVRSPGA